MTVLPGQEPVRKPHPARHAFSIVGLILWVVVIMGGFFAAAYYVSSVLTNGNMAAVISSALVDLTNEDRAGENLGALTIDPLLVVAAQAKANDMAQKGYFAHVTPEGYQPWHFIKEAGYEYSSAGENLAVNFSDSENVEEAWMNSPKHRANILNAKFTQVGIATAKGEYQGRTTTFVVQMFGTPRSALAVAEEETVVPENPEDIAVTVSENTPQILGSEVPTVSEESLIEETPSAVVSPETEAPSYAGIAGRLMTSPENLLRTIYLVCGLIILTALALTTRLEFRRHHVRQVAAAAFLLVFMAGTLIVADAVIFTEPILAEASQLLP